LEELLQKICEGYIRADKIKILKFQHLFNALELVTNMDGDDRKGHNFDKKANILSKLDLTNQTKTYKYQSVAAFLYYAQTCTAKIEQSRRQKEIL
jgi:hypothetical protein